MRGISVRIGTSWAGAVLGLGLLGCTTIGFGPERSTSLELQAPSEVVAWHLGALCRAAHPGLDPQPGSARAPLPIWSDGEGNFAIELGGGGDLPIRISQNGRLPAPRLDDEVHWSPRPFLPAGHSTGCGGPSLAVVEVEATAAGHTRLSMAFYGEMLHSDLPDRLERAARLIDSVSRCATLLERDRRQACEQRIELSLAALQDSQEIGLGQIEAPLHLMRADLRERSGDLLAARLSLRTAQSLLPDAVRLRQRIAELDQRLARPEDAERGWRLLVVRAAEPDIRRSAESRLRERQRMRIGHSEAEFAAASAVRMFDHGDRLGGLSWARLARSLGGESTAMGQLDAHARALNDHRSAMAIGLARLHDRGFDADAIEQICDDALAAGEPAAALRLLAAHWEDLRQRRPELALRLLERAGAASGPAMTARVLSASRSHNLTDRALAEWRAASPDSNLGAELLARVERLRSSLDPGLPDSPADQDGFEHAPGVAAPAR